MENIAPAKEEKLNLSQEAMSGRVLGFILGTIPFARTPRPLLKLLVNDIFVFSR
jgi:hypothetical protein